VFESAVSEARRYRENGGDVMGDMLQLLGEDSVRTVQYSTVQYSTVQYSTAQHSTVQYSAVQYSTVQYSTVQYSTVLLLMYTADVY
jgi:hypothetical protein